MSAMRRGGRRFPHAIWTRAARAVIQGCAAARYRCEPTRCNHVRFAAGASMPMNRDRLHFLFLNIGHFLDHLFTLIFASVAALALSREWSLDYGDLLKYATPGFFAFGVFAYPAGWLADRWSREGMMVVFFVGIGLASFATGFAQSPLQVGIGLFVIGMFAAIYHPVGLAMVTQKWKNTGMRLAVNGVWGNLGVASAALITGFLIDHGGWRMAFIIPGSFSAAVGVAYLLARRDEISVESAKPAAGPVAQ